MKTKYRLVCKLPWLMVNKDPRLSQRQLARELDISTSTINKMYNGQPFEGRVDSEIVEKLCEYFNCGLSDLLVLEAFPVYEEEDIKEIQAEWEADRNRPLGKLGHYPPKHLKNP